MTMTLHEQDNGRWGMIHYCPACRWPVPVRSVRPDEKPARWVCGWCTRVFDGVLEENATEEHRRFARYVDDK